jgi:hypothetical protein
VILPLLARKDKRIVSCPIIHIQISYPLHDASRWRTFFLIHLYFGDYGTLHSPGFIEELKRRHMLAEEMLCSFLGEDVEKNFCQPSIRCNGIFYVELDVYE